MLWSLFLTLGLGQLCTSTPLAKRWDDLVEKHSWPEVPRGWQNLGSAPSDHTLDLRIALKQDKFDELVATLFEVSNPEHERFVRSL
jgi:tripeptidyl-peptidase I